MKNITTIAELKKKKIWVCWNIIEKNGKKTKVPCSSSGKATGTNSNYEHTWVTFEEAEKSARENNFSGVGFIIP